MNDLISEHDIDNGGTQSTGDEQTPDATDARLQALLRRLQARHDSDVDVNSDNVKLVCKLSRSVWKISFEMNCGSRVQAAARITPCDGVERQRALERELKLMVCLDHPNVIRCHGGKVQEEEGLLIMELAGGGDLERYLHVFRAGSPLSSEEVMVIGCGIAAALSYIHPWVIHCAVRPQNVLLTSEGLPKLANFTKMDVVEGAGSVSFVGAVQDRADVFSLGMLMWECLAVQDLELYPPFAGVDHYDEDALAGRRPAIPAGCDAALASIIAQCWHESAAKRPSAAEVLQQLEAALDGRSNAAAVGAGADTADALALRNKLQALGELPAELPKAQELQGKWEVVDEPSMSPLLLSAVSVALESGHAEGSKECALSPPQQGPARLQRLPSLCASCRWGRLGGSPASGKGAELDAHMPLRRQVAREPAQAPALARLDECRDSAKDSEAGVVSAVVKALGEPVAWSDVVSKLSALAGTGVPFLGRFELSSPEVVLLGGVAMMHGVDTAPSLVDCTQAVTSCFYQHREDFLHMAEFHRRLGKKLRCTVAALSVDEAPICFADGSASVLPPCIVLERSNRTLREHIRHHPRISRLLLRDIVVDVVEALQEWHRADLAYRDLQPAAVVHVSNGPIKTWKLQPPLSWARCGASVPAVCTLRYAPPEVVLASSEGEAVVASKAADMWALGILLYELLALHPFGHDCPSDYVRSMLLGQEPLPWELSDTCWRTFRSKKAASVVQQLLARDPEQRPSIADVLSSAFYRSLLAV